MRNRIIIAIPLLAVVLSGFVFDWARPLGLVLLVILALACATELTGMARRMGARPSGGLALLAVLVMVLLGCAGRFMDSLLVLGLVLVLAMLGRMRRGTTEGAWRDVTATLGTVVYAGLPLAAAAELFVHSPETRAWLLLALLVAWLSDTGAMIAGKNFGRSHPFPRLSPGKTLEGCFGGAIGAMFAVPVAVLFVGQNLSAGPGDLIVVALLLGFLAQAGDLAESLLKREAGVKDSGRILGGHGGALDRVDALLFMLLPYVACLRWLRPEIFPGG